MLNFILILFGLLSSMSFGQITSQNANTGAYSAIPQIVRDFYSKEVLYQAQPRCMFLQFAKVKKDLQAVRSKSIVFTKYNNLAGGGSIAEKDVFVPQAMGANEIQISVTEQINGIQLTELLVRTSLMNVIEDATKVLANNLAIVLDEQFRDAVLATTNIVYGNGAASSTAMTTGSLFNTRTVKDAVELLAMNNAPKFANETGSYYVCIASPKAIRQLRDDSAWQAANTYMGRRQLYVGEAGMYEGVIFIESTNMPHLTSAEVVTKYGGSFTPTYGCESVIFGENAYAWAVALDVELRDDGIVEMGRKHTIGWYGIWGMGIIEEDNVVRVLTAATA